MLETNTISKLIRYILYTVVRGVRTSVLTKLNMLWMHFSGIWSLVCAGQYADSTWLPVSLPSSAILFVLGGVLLCLVAYRLAGIIHRAGPFTVKRRSRDTPNDANVDTAFNILPLNQPSDQHTTCESKTLIEPGNGEVYKMETWVKLLLINHFLPRWPHKPDLRGDFNRTVALNALLQSDSNTNFQKHKAL